MGDRLDLHSSRVGQIQLDPTVPAPRHGHHDRNLRRLPQGPTSGPSSTHRRPRMDRYRVATAAATSTALILGIYLGLSTNHQPRPATVPTAPAAASPPPPVTVAGLVDVLRAHPALAGSAGSQLDSALLQVATSTGEARRQASLAVLQIAGSGHVSRDYARAATAAVSPFTQLGTPTDMIQDLGPNPAVAGPNAHFVLNCMKELTEGTAAQQQNEANEIVEKLPQWAANGGIRPDITAATQQIAATMAQGHQPTDDDDDDDVISSSSPQPGK
jgi:hypothetical protein